MWFSVSAPWLVVGGVGLLLAGALTMAAAYLVFRVAVSAAAQEVVDRQTAQAGAEAAKREAAAKVAELAAITPQLMRVNGELHTKAHWDAVAVSERMTSIALQAAEDAAVIHARLENALLLSEWVREGGNPGAPWTEIVKWKNQQEKKG